MGRIDAALYHGLAFAVLLFTAVASASPVTGTIKGVKFPEYSVDGKLEYMLYSEIANPRGVTVDMRGVLVDFVKENISAETMTDNRKVELYTIEQSSKLDDKIPAFWKLYTKTKVFCRTPKAKYDRTTKMIRGDEKVRFRSYQMDADGVGFDLDQKNGTLRLRSNVRVVFRDKDEEKPKEKNIEGSEKNEK